MGQQLQAQTHLLDPGDANAVTPAATAPIRPLVFFNLFVELVKFGLQSAWEAGRIMGIIAVPLFILVGLIAIPLTQGFGAVLNASWRYGESLFVGLFLGPMHLGGMGIFAGLLTSIVLSPLVWLLYTRPWHISLHRMLIRAGGLAVAVAFGPDMARPAIRQFHQIIEWETWWSRGVLSILAAVVWLYLTERLVSWYEEDRADREPRPLIGPVKPELLDDPAFQRELFAALATRYNQTSAVASLGFDRRWRARLVAQMELAPGAVVCDLMSGTGELWPHLLEQIGPQASITAVDASPQMLAQAEQRRSHLAQPDLVVLHEADTCHTGLPDACFDAVVCAFGVKTLNHVQQVALADEIQRLVRPGGSAGIIELSQPQRPLLRWAQRVYLAHLLPRIAELLGASPHAHALLAAYAARTPHLKTLSWELHRRGFTVHTTALSGNCATLLVAGKKTA